LQSKTHKAKINQSNYNVDILYYRISHCYGTYQCRSPLEQSVPRDLRRTATVADENNALADPAAQQQHSCSWNDDFRMSSPEWDTPVVFIGSRGVPHILHVWHHAIIWC